MVSVINKYQLKYRLNNRVYSRGHYDYVGVRATTAESAKEKLEKAVSGRCSVTIYAVDEQCRAPGASTPVK